MTPTTELVPLQQYESGLLGVGQSIGSLKQCEKVHASHFPFLTLFSSNCYFPWILAHLSFQMWCRGGGTYHRGQETEGTRGQPLSRPHLHTEQFIPLTSHQSIHESYSSKNETKMSYLVLPIPSITPMWDIYKMLTRIGPSWVQLCLHPVSQFLTMLHWWVTLLEMGGFVL